MMKNAKFMHPGLFNCGLIVYKLIYFNFGLPMT